MMAAAAALLLSSLAGLRATAAEFEACWASLEASKWAEAIPCFQELVGENPDWAWGHAYLGQAFFGAGKHDEAIASLEKAMSLLGSDEPGLEPYFYAAQAYLAKKQLPKAMEALKRGEPHVPPEQQADYLALRGRINYEFRKYPQAVADLKKSGKKDFDTLYLIGTASYLADDFAAATDALEAALKAKPEHSGCAEFLSLAFFQRAENTSDERTRQQLYSRAADVGRVMLAKDANSADGHSLLGRALMGARDFAGAEKEFNEVLRLKPGHCGAQANLAQLAVAKKQYDRAIELGSKAVTCLKDEQKREAHLTVGHALSGKAKQAGEGAADTDVRPRETAIALYEKAVQQFQAADAIRSTSATAGQLAACREAMAALRSQIDTIKRNRDAEAANKAAAEQERAEAEKRKQLEDALGGRSPK